MVISIGTSLAGMNADRIAESAVKKQGHVIINN